MSQHVSNDLINIRPMHKYVSKFTVIGRETSTTSSGKLNCGGEQRQLLFGGRCTPDKQAHLSLLGTEMHAVCAQAPCTSSAPAIWSSPTFQRWLEAATSSSGNVHQPGLKSSSQNLLDVSSADLMRRSEATRCMFAHEQRGFCTDYFAKP
jgi:hypothetical protein